MNHQSDRTIISIRINLPDYGKWRLTAFVRAYPYLSIVLGFLGLISLILILNLLLSLI